MIEIVIKYRGHQSTVSPQWARIMPPCSNVVGFRQRLRNARVIVVQDTERMAGGVLVCGFAGLELPNTLQYWLADRSLGGLILFKRNIVSIEQTRELIESCTAGDDPQLPTLICIDQEGGRVSRLPEPVLKLPAMRVLGAHAEPELTRQAATALGRQLRAIGINLDFAPVLDVDTNPDNPVIGDRAFGNEPERVIEHALAFAEGLMEAGVLACGKHFPGHGDTDTDSHLALPRLVHDLERLNAVELPPFAAAVGRIPSLMTAHVVFEAIDPDAPATMSDKVISGLLRENIGFRGAVFSDDLEMQAITAHGSVEEAAVRAIAAGCDLLLVCSDVDAARRARRALVDEASRNEAFQLRLREAAGRATALRRRAASLPGPRPLEETLANQELDAIREQLRTLC